MTTIEYYSRAAAEFSTSTLNLDLSHIYKQFLNHVPHGGKILDAGCGSGRDALAFKQMGYEVTAFDACEPMAKIASQNLSQRVHVLRFEELSFEDAFDGIWACASLLHVNKADLPNVLTRLGSALHQGGALYVSFKLGNTERTDANGRFFLDLDQCGLQQALSGCLNLSLQKDWITSDCRPGRAEEYWLNAIIQK
jgi:2-polyprenyl-3-methyl-5-hydroxy-6-metoxy-1,4-benzoquinol methylase